jgi:hypothetical protein
LIDRTSFRSPLPANSVAMTSSYATGRRLRLKICESRGPDREGNFACSTGL